MDCSEPAGATGLPLLLPVFTRSLILATIRSSLPSSRRSLGQRGFVGLDNWRALGNRCSTESIKQTAIYAAIALPGEILGGLASPCSSIERSGRTHPRGRIYRGHDPRSSFPQIAVGVIFRLVYAP
jgi:ABC-type sugar transport system permease subunit